MSCCHCHTVPTAPFPVEPSAETPVFYIVAKVIDGRIELTELMSCPGGEPRHCFKFADYSYQLKPWELLYCQPCMEKLWEFHKEESHDS